MQYDGEKYSVLRDKVTGKPIKLKISLVKSREHIKCCNKRDNFMYYYFFIIALLSYISHATQFTHLKHIINGF